MKPNTPVNWTVKRWLRFHPFIGFAELGKGQALFRHGDMRWHYELRFQPMNRRFSITAEAIHTTGHGQLNFDAGEDQMLILYPEPCKGGHVSLPGE